MNKWTDWGKRYRAVCQEKEVSLAQVAEKIGRAEPTVRSWTNGTRMAGLDDFFALCDAIGADPSYVLFGVFSISQEEKDALGRAVKAVLEADPAVHPNYPKLIRQIKKAPRHS